MKFAEIAARLNGFSTPIFGVQWQPPTVDVDVARRIITFLEDRRVLYSSYTNEVPEQCVQSVLQIRAFLTEVLGNGGIAKELAAPLRLMRGHCIRFLNRVGANQIPGDQEGAQRRLFHDRRYHMHDYFFGEAIG